MQAGGQRFDSVYLHHMRKWLSGRASPCQGEGREFESRLPLHLKALLSSMDKRAFLLYGFKCTNDKAAAGGHGGVSDIANRRIEDAGLVFFLCFGACLCSGEVLALS